MRLSITRRVVGLIAIPLVFQVSVLGLLAWMQRIRDDTLRQSFHSKEVIAQTRIVLRLMVDAETGIRGYAVTNDPLFTARFDEASQQLPDRLQSLRELTKDDPQQAAHAHVIDGLANDSVAQLTRTKQLIHDRKEKPEGQGVQKDEASDRIRAGKVLMDRLRSQVDQLLEAQNARDSEQTHRVDRLEQWINGLLVGGTIATFVLTGAMLFFFWRVIGQRFATLTTNTKRFAANEPLLPPLDGTDEMAQLDKVFRAMTVQTNAAMERLSKAAEEIHNLYNHAPCGYHSVDRDGNIVAINDTELRWLGYRRDEIIGRLSYRELMTEASRRAFAEFFPRFQRLGFINNIEYEYVRKDGTVLPVMVTATAVRDESGNYLASRSSVFDMTERKRAEQTIQLYADIVKNISTGLLIFRLERSIDSHRLFMISANPVASDLLGITLSESTGKTITEVFPALPNSVIECYVRVAVTGRVEDLGEIRYGDERVAEKWWSVQAFPLPENCVGVAFQNISDRKRAEAEIHRLNEELENRVRERTAELAEANRDLIQKNQENEMFVYSVSHDLRSPLVNLQGFSKELGKGCEALQVVLADDRLPADVRSQGENVLSGKMAKALGFIQSAVLRLSSIIDALLRLSRAGRVEYRWQSVDVQPLVAQIVAAAHGTITEKKATIEVGKLPPVWGDSTALEQVFANLIANALNYLDPKRPGKIEVGHLIPSEGSNTPDGFVTYFVRDNGLGIAPAHHQKIFQVFQRVHGSVAKGEGIGLAIVIRIVERHRGKIWVESQEGVGSTFFVSLPASADSRPG